MGRVRVSPVFFLTLSSFLYLGVAVCLSPPCIGLLLSFVCLSLSLSLFAFCLGNYLLSEDIGRAER